MLPWLSARTFARISSKPASKHALHFVNSNKLPLQVCHKVTCNPLSFMDQVSNPSLPLVGLNVVPCHTQVNLAWLFPACQVLALASFPADILSKVAACLKDSSFLP